MPVSGLDWVSPNPPSVDRPCIAILRGQSHVQAALAAWLQADLPAYEVLMAASPAALVAITQARAPALIIVDVDNQFRKGVGLIRQLRRQEPQLPILALGAGDAAPYAQAAYQAGADRYIAHSQLDEQVILIIRDLLAGRSRLRPGVTTSS